MASCGIMIGIVRKDGATDRIPCPGRVFKWNEATSKWDKEEPCEHTHQRPHVPYRSTDADNLDLRARSGDVTVVGSKLTSFLYDLMRDHLPAGTVEKLVRDAKDGDVAYTNGWLAAYAEDLAKRLE